MRRYLKVMDRILASVLPTARNVSKEIATCETREEFKGIVPGPTVATWEPTRICPA